MIFLRLFRFFYFIVNFRYFSQIFFVGPSAYIAKPEVILQIKICCYNKRKNGFLVSDLPTEITSCYYTHRKSPPYAKLKENMFSTSYFKRTHLQPL